MFIQKSVIFLLFSLVSTHCGQLVAPDKIKATNGDKIKHGKYGFKTIGQSTAESGIPLGDFKAPKEYVGLNEEESYMKMVNDGFSVKDLFNQAVQNDVVKHYEYPKFGNFTADTCGYYDPEFEVEIAEDTNPQTSTTGNNHGGPAEVWIDGVMTHHISNLMYQQPEVLSRDTYNCDKEYCLYKWYWIAFRADQPVPTFQMWVNCARIKGNGKSPIPVEPTPMWLNDPRGEHPNLYIKPNDVSLPICENPSQKIVASYSSGTVSYVNSTETLPTLSSSAASSSPSVHYKQAAARTKKRGNTSKPVYTASSPALTSVSIPAPTNTPYAAPVKPPTSLCRGQRRKKSIYVGR
jgi:hypothetical protein